jgi:tripartite-type tricarboxylate transporter receptor subunit TctC
MKKGWLTSKLILVIVLGLFALLVGCNSNETTNNVGTNPPENTSSEEKVDYPTKDITFLVGSKPGGGYDTWARGLAPFLEKHLPNDVNVIVENDGAANGKIAANKLHNAEPDGYHFNIVNSGLAATEGEPGVDYSLKEWTWLGALTQEYQVMVASKDSGIKTIDDLIAKNGDFIFSSSGWSGTSDTSFLIFAETLGLTFDDIYHDGTSEVMLSLVRGDSDITFGSTESVIDYIKRGDVVPIVFFGEGRHELLPDVPSIAEAGYPELEGLGGNRLLAAPPGVPDEIKKVLVDAIEASVNDPEYKAWAEQEGRTISYAGPESAAKAVDRHIERFDKHREIIAKYNN